MRIAPLLPLVAGLALSGVSHAQDADDFRAKYEAEIAEDWVSHGGWILDLDEALARAKKENKLVFAYFTRSYAP